MDNELLHSDEENEQKSIKTEGQMEINDTGGDEKEKKKAQKRAARKKDILSYLVCFAIGAAIGLLIKFIWCPVAIVGSSMYPTLKDGQIYLTDTRFTEEEITYGTIVGIKLEDSKFRYVKRVVALPGDTIQVSDGILYVNGEESPYQFEYINDGGMIQDYMRFLAEDEYFCMGDNRNDSTDSRSFGPVRYENIKQIIGKKIH